MSEQSQAIAIHLEGLSKTYRPDSDEPVHAVQDVDLSVPTGQVFGLLGANGAGKTTTIKMMCGLITPSAGTVTLNGYDVARDHRAAMQQIGVVLEGTRNIYWRLSAVENLMHFARLKGKFGSTIKTRVETLLHELDLWERRNDATGNFSRGMQQKVAVACALVADPPLVLLDEPTLGLDVQAARTVRTWVKRLATDEGKTVVLTTHQLDMAQELCDRVAIIRDGRIIADQPLSELLQYFQQDYYQVRVEGEVAPESSWLNGLTLAAGDNGNTVISGPIADQATLYRLLTRLRDAECKLLSINRSEPDLEEVFVRMIGEEE